jgi:hypothetical protein
MWAPTGVKASNQANATNNLAISLPGTGRGSTLFVASTAWAASSQATVHSVTDDTNPGSYTAVQFYAPNDQAVALHVLPRNLGGDIIIGVDPGGNVGDSQDIWAAAIEFIGGAESPILGSPVTALGGGGGPPGQLATTGPYTPTIMDALILAVLVHDTGGSITENAFGEGYTLVADNDHAITGAGESGSFVYKILPRMGVGQPQLTSWAITLSEVWGTIIAGFSPAPDPALVVDQSQLVPYHGHHRPRGWSMKTAAWW